MHISESETTQNNFLWERVFGHVQITHHKDMEKTASQSPKILKRPSAKVTCCQEVHTAIGDLHRAALTRRGLRARAGPRCEDLKQLLMLRIQSQGPNRPLLLRLFGNIGSSLVLPVASRPTWGKLHCSYNP